MHVPSYRGPVLKWACAFAVFKGESSEPDVTMAEEFLQKAKTMFRDLGLHQDLEDLNSVIHRIRS